MCCTLYFGNLLLETFYLFVLEAIYGPVAVLIAMFSMSSDQHWERIIVLIGSGKQLVGYW